MANYGSIEVIELSLEDKQRYENLMASAYHVLLAAATKRYNLQVGPSLVRRLRSDFKSGKCNLVHDPQARSFMRQMIEIEPIILGAYIRLGHNYFRKFDMAGQKQRPGVVYGDYVQEGAWGIYDAQYTFTGSHEFSTFTQTCIRNRLVSFVRNEERAAGISVVVKALRLKVRRLMSDYHYDFDQAIAHIRANGDTLKDDVVDKIKDALYAMNEMVSDDEVASIDSHHNIDPTDTMRESVKEVDLTELERLLVEAHLDENRGFRADFVSQKRYRYLRVRLLGSDVNPNTGNPWTRQTLSQHFVRACEKMREIYELKEYGLKEAV